MHHVLQPVRSGIKDDTQEEIQVETSAEEKAVENFEEVVPWRISWGQNPGFLWIFEDFGAIFDTKIYSNYP